MTKILLTVSRVLLTLAGRAQNAANPAPKTVTRSLTVPGSEKAQVFHFQPIPWADARNADHSLRLKAANIKMVNEAKMARLAATHPSLFFTP